jgi:hypothetical protein
MSAGIGVRRNYRYQMRTIPVALSSPDASAFFGKCPDQESNNVFETIEECPEL